MIYPNLSKEYFQKQLDLLKLEWDEDKRSYLQQTANSGVADRRAGGLTWYPVAIRGSEMGRGDYLTVELERTTHQDLPHQFRFGAAASLFSNHDPANCRLDGTVSFQNGNLLKLTLSSDELPDWASDGKLGIDLLFDENSYNEMQKALKAASIQTTGLVKILTGQTSPTFSTSIPELNIPALNAMQNKAVNTILRANELAVVHGPPGTGKTTTIVQAVKQLLKQDGRKILVVAPSNTAVDLLTEKLSDEGINVLRIGNPVRVSERLLALTVEGKMALHQSIKQVKQLKKQANEYRVLAHRYKRNYGRAEREQRKALFDEAHKIMQEVARTEQFIIDDLLAGAQVITATPVGSNHYTVRDLEFKTLIIDEAGQALEAACWIPILKAEKVILAGDHCQLPPTIKSEDAARLGLAETLLEKLVEAHPEAVCMLREQYRMNSLIMHYPSRVFYSEKLVAHALVADQLLHAADIPLSFIDTAGCGFDEDSEGTSICNPDEASFIVRHLGNLLLDCSRESPLPSVAIISPYKEQIVRLKELIDSNADLGPFRSCISVNTIDGFQGQERDVVYISMTRSNTEGSIGFLSDTRRMNVAMTRARKKLVVVGDSATLSRLGFYSDFISYAEELNAYQSAWEFV